MARFQLVARAVFLVSVVLVGALLSNKTAQAAPCCLSASLFGVELAFTPTEGIFFGNATGAYPGTWSADVHHTVLSPDAVITGGTFKLKTKIHDQNTTVNANFSDGSIVLTNPSTGCANQIYAVNGTLTDVTAMGGDCFGTGIASFQGSLVHLRRMLFGQCVTYSAVVTGVVFPIFQPPCTCTLGGNEYA